MSTPLTPDSVYLPRAKAWVGETAKTLDEAATKQAIQTLLLSKEKTLGLMRILLGIAMANLQKGRRYQAQQFLEVAQMIAGLHFASIDIAAHAANQPKKDTQA